MLNALLSLLIVMHLDPGTAYAALAVSACESGDTITFGSYDATARSATADGGAFQFNDATWFWITDQSTTTADTASLYYQVIMFDHLWNHGSGSTHWSASRECWNKWINDDGSPKNPMHYLMYTNLFNLYQY